MNIYLLILLVSQMIASFSQVLLKKSTERSYPNRIREYLNAFVICGYGMMFISLYLTMMSYRGFTNFAAIPVLESMGYILVMLLSRIFFHEKITQRKLLGMCCILVGIVIYNML